MRRVSALPMVMLLADRLASTVAPASAAAELGGTGTQKSSQISACTTRSGRSSAANSRSVPHGASKPGHADLLSGDRVAGHEMAALVELAVVGQVGLRHHAQQPAAMDSERRVVQPPGVAHRRTYQQQGQQGRRILHQARDRLLHRVQQRVLLQQVADGVAGHAEFGEYRHRHRLVVALPGHAQDGLRIRRRVGQGHPRRARGDAGEAVPVKRAERSGRGHVGSCLAAGRTRRDGFKMAIFPPQSIPGHPRPRRRRGRRACPTES